MNIAFVGCGYVADFYATTLKNHRGLNLSAVWDRDADRLSTFCAHWKVKAAASLEAVLHPASTKDLYFVADGSGGHAFAETLDEHNRNVAAWRKLQTQQSSQ